MQHFRGRKFEQETMKPGEMQGMFQSPQSMIRTSGLMGTIGGHQHLSAVTNELIDGVRPLEKLIQLLLVGLVSEDVIELGASLHSLNRGQLCSIATDRLEDLG